MEARVVYETRWVEAGTGATPHTVIFSLAPGKRQIQPCLRGPNSCFRVPKSMREPASELNGSIKDKKSVLRCPSFSSASCFNTSSWFAKDEESTERVTLGPSRDPGPITLPFMRAPHEGPTAADSVYADPGAHANS